MGDMHSTNKFMFNKIKALAREEQIILDRGGSCYGLNVWVEKRIEELIEELESSLSQSLGDHVDTGKYANTLEAKLKELETENKSLRDALFVIGNRDKDCDGRCRPQARKALEKDNE